MPVTLRTTDAISTIETKPISAVHVEGAVQTTERVPNQKAAFRKFVAEGHMIQLQVQGCPPEESLTDQFNTGSLQQKVQRKEIDPHTLIHVAILENNPAVIRFLLEQGVDVDYPDLNGMSPLTMGLVNRCNYAVEVLLEHGANTNPRTKWNDMTLLEISLFMNDINSANLLVDHGADVNGIGKSKVGVLGKVIYMGRGNAVWIDLAKKMIIKGANINACERNCENVNAPLFDAISIADRSLLEMFIQRGVNLNMQHPVNQKNANYTNITPLLLAVTWGKLDLVRVLVENGADVNKSIRDAWQKERTPLKDAVEKGHPEIVQYLLQHGARA